MLIERLCRQTGLSRSQIDKFAATASIRYKTYSVEKRNGGLRSISQPSREIKALQRWLVRVLFRKFPVHPSATAYAKGSSIRLNAEQHVASNFTLRLDFRDFFPSFGADAVERFLVAANLERNLELTPDDLAFVAKIVSRHGRLTIGAPSSPIITNVLMHNFDEALSKWSDERDVTYTRYADDIFLSSMQRENLIGANAYVSGIAKSHEFAKLVLNDEKTVFLSRKARRAITGLVITSDRKISIGRERKRQIRSLIHIWRIGKLENEELAYLRGMLAFVSDVEPTFYAALSQKYGRELIRSLSNVNAIGSEAST